MYLETNYLLDLSTPGQNLRETISEANYKVWMTISALSITFVRSFIVYYQYKYDKLALVKSLGEKHGVLQVAEFSVGILNVSCLLTSKLRKIDSLGVYYRKISKPTFPFLILIVY